MRALRIGTRASALARWQAEWVQQRLIQLGVAAELVLISTRGDKEQHDPIGNLGETGVFTKELQRALLEEKIDVAVHSLKDLPTDEVSGLTLAAVPERENPFDVLITRGGETLERLRPEASVGTGSLRRRAQLLSARRDLQPQHIRGNVDTRLKKLEAGEFDALVLAAAGLSRLGLLKRATEVLEPPRMLPAIGQGALGIECRVGDVEALATVAAIDHRDSRHAVIAERSLLAALRGGCLAPIAGWGRIAGGQLALTAAVLSFDGQRRLDVQATSSIDNAVQLGQQVANDLLGQGAAGLIDEARGQL